MLYTYTSAKQLTPQCTAIQYSYTYPARLVDNLKSIPHHTNMRTPNGEDIPAVNERFRHRLAAENLKVRTLCDTIGSHTIDPRTVRHPQSPGYSSNLLRQIGLWSTLECISNGIKSRFGLLVLVPRQDCAVREPRMVIRYAPNALS